MRSGKIAKITRKFQTLNVLKVRWDSYSLVNECCQPHKVNLSFHSFLAGIIANDDVAPTCGRLCTVCVIRLPCSRTRSLTNSPSMGCYATGALTAAGSLAF